MGKKLCFSLVLVAVFFLCACAGPEPTGDTTVHTTDAPTTQIPTTQTTAAPTTMPATAPTAPLHSPLYLPGYTTQQIREYFEEVVLHVEYSSGTGDASLVQKWTEPIRYRIFGTPTGEDLAVLEDFFEQLNAVPGFAGIRAAREGEAENLSLRFLNPDGFRDIFSAVVNGEEAYGAVQFWYYTNTNEIYTAQIGYRTDIDQTARSSILVEEIVNALGITDTILRTDSIVYQYSDDNMTLSEVDWLLLKLLYDPAIQCGMNADRCAAVIETLYY